MFVFFCCCLCCSLTTHLTILLLRNVSENRTGIIWITCSVSPLQLGMFSAWACWTLFYIRWGSMNEIGITRTRSFFQKVCWSWFCDLIWPLQYLCLRQDSKPMHKPANPGYLFIWEVILCSVVCIAANFLLETLAHGLKHELIAFLIPPLSGLCEKVHDPLGQTVAWLWTGFRIRIPVLCKEVILYNFVFFSATEVFQMKNNL